jgi:hypothetical protein
MSETKVLISSKKSTSSKTRVSSKKSSQMIVKEEEEEEEDNKFIQIPINYVYPTVYNGIAYLRLPEECKTLNTVAIIVKQEE